MSTDALTTVVVTDIAYERPMNTETLLEYMEYLHPKMSSELSETVNARVSQQRK